MANGILTLNPNFPERNLEGKKLPLIEAPVGAGIGLALVNFLKDKNKENLPEKTDEEKTPQEEPPEDPNVLPELLAETAVDKVKNKIKTWDKYFDSKEEAEQVAKENNITLRDLEIPAIKKQINFKKTGDGFDIYFDKKLIGELQDITFLKQEDNTQIGNQRSFNLSLIGKDGFMGEAYDTLQGIEFAKEAAKSDIAKDLLTDTTEPRYPSLKDIFQNLEYDKKGEPVKVKKAMGGLIDKPLTGNSRYI